MQIAIPEKDKKAGVCYAVTKDGLELPVVDVTHPAFALDVSESELDRLSQGQVRSMQSMGRLAKIVQPLMLRLMSRRSMIMRGILGSAGRFMSGLDTYLLKVGAENLGAGYASQIDRQIAGSVSGLSVRLRLQDIAHLLADALVPVLRAEAKKPLHLLNIGGGPCIDSLNALIILWKRQPALLPGRPIFIRCLDLDEAGPAFGRRALAALQSEGAPLHSLQVDFQHTRYNWSDVDVLSGVLQTIGKDAVIAVSSEGALFEYGSDEDITANLRVLHDETPASAVVAGSVTRADETGRFLNSSSRAAIRLRPLPEFIDLIERAGWSLARRVDRPLSHDVCLKKRER